MFAVYSKLVEYFTDPRFSRERIFGFVAIPLSIVVVAVSVFALFPFKSDEERTQQISATSAQAKELAPIEVAGLEIQMGNPATAEKILLAESAKPNCGAEVHRRIAILLEDRGDFQGATESWTKAVRTDPVPLDYLHRGECFVTLGMMGEAGIDFNEAVRLAPSNAFFSNRLYLFRIACGDTKGVRDRINLEMRIGVTNAMDGWIVAAAALALQEGKVEAARRLLEEAELKWSAADLSHLLKDPLFDPYRNEPSLSRFLPAFGTPRTSDSASPKIEK